VAGEAALLAAKLHKLGDRLNKPRRLEAKDAGDVYRLFDVIASDELATRLGVLLADPRSASTTTRALEYGNELFGGTDRNRGTARRRRPACGRTGANGRVRPRRLLAIADGGDLR
jgi:hypothetical protein